MQARPSNEFSIPSVSEIFVPWRQIFSSEISSEKSRIAAQISEIVRFGSSCRDLQQLGWAKKYSSLACALRVAITVLTLWLKIQKIYCFFSKAGIKFPHRTRIAYLEWGGRDGDNAVFKGWLGCKWRSDFWGIIPLNRDQIWKFKNVIDIFN